MKTIPGMFLLVDRKNDPGMIHWIDELARRKIPALVLADGRTITRNPDLIKETAQKGFDLGVSYNDGALWTETFDDFVAWLPSWFQIVQPHLKSSQEIQHKLMHFLNDRLLPLTGKTMVAYSGKYFSYNEDTLRIADEMGVPYILARGTEQARAVFYQPREYQPTLVSVSNVPSKELGTGSLCDESLAARNSTPADFRDLLFSLDVDRVILVAQTHVSGVEWEWWDVYMEYLDSGRVEWQALKDFVASPRLMAYRDIPVNKRAEYMPLNLEKAKLVGEMV